MRSSYASAARPEIDSADSSMQIRPATLEDAATIAQFNLLLAEETEERFLDRTIVERGVARALEHDLGARYVLAEQDGVAVGQLMTTREWSDWHDGWYVWLQSVFVVKDFRGCGVFRAMLAHVLRSAADCGDVFSVRLYVEKDNETAMQTYQRLGFATSDYLVMEREIEKKPRDS